MLQKVKPKAWHPVRLLTDVLRPIRRLLTWLSRTSAIPPLRAPYGEHTRCSDCSPCQALLKPWQYPPEQERAVVKGQGPCPSRCLQPSGIGPSTVYRGRTTPVVRDNPVAALYPQLYHSSQGGQALSLEAAVQPVWH